jgi:iron complex transport system substrate-binding protein
MLASWCGKKFRPERVAARPGWESVSAVKDQQLFEIKSADILQPGPAALTDGVRRIHEILRDFVSRAPRKPT